jgi:basic membrane protein A and related proteins
MANRTMTLSSWRVGAAVLVVAAIAAAALLSGQTTPAGASAARTLKVGLSVDEGQLNDHGFNQLAYAGLKKAESVLGVQGRVVQAASAADYVPNMATLARQGYDLIIGVGFAQGDAIAAVAKRFPKTRFAIVDVSNADLKGKPKNVEGLLFKEQEVGYLVGYLGALAEKRAGGSVISAVGGFKQPPVDRYIAGYIAGAKKAVPGTKVIWGYSHDWVDLAKCKELALTQIARGSGVVFQVAGGCGLGALNAAQEKRVWGIGVDADQSFLGSYVLTSALKGVDTSVFLTVKALQNGTLRGGADDVFGLDRAGVGLGKVSPKAAKADVAATRRIAAQLAAGKIKNIPTTIGVSP